jgi:hypothetical protein
MEGLGDPCGARTFWIVLGGVEVRLRVPTSLRYFISLGPISHQTTAAEPPWGHGLAGGHLSKVPDPASLTKLFPPNNLCFINFGQKHLVRAPKATRSTPCQPPGPQTCGSELQEICLALFSHAKYSCQVLFRLAQGPRPQTLRFYLDRPPATWARSGD